MLSFVHFTDQPPKRSLFLTSFFSLCHFYPNPDKPAIGGQAGEVPKVDVCFLRLGVIGVFAYLDVHLFPPVISIPPSRRQIPSYCLILSSSFKNRGDSEAPAAANGFQAVASLSSAHLMKHGGQYSCSCAGDGVAK